KRSRPRKLGYMEERELEGMEASIQQAEEGIQSLEDTLNDPQFYVERAHEAQAMTEALESRRQEVTALYHRWEELLAIKEASEQGKGG
ncbi:MAG: ABC transporter ATP-binding protein, partial [Verrucomicrobiota bacterium]|nr:ABC transporter ATP-binding protein [Verrucomicrobiota bacterium]